MNLREQLVRDEGGRQPALYYVNGVPHIGVGHNLRDVPISESAIDQIFADDLVSAERQLAHALPWTWRLDDARRGALLNLVFNMGIGGLLTFKKMLEAMKIGDYAAAAKELLDSDYATQVGPRAPRVAKQIRTGVWI